MLTGIRLVSEAAGLAARRHSGRQRKGCGNEPYINHFAEVADLLSAAAAAMRRSTVCSMRRLRMPEARCEGAVCFTAQEKMMFGGETCP
jgi:hypothetical protein